MGATLSFDLPALLDSALSLGAAFVLGAVIGLERQVRQRTAGLRTNTLVCVGAAVFVDLAVRFHSLHSGSTGPLQVVAYVVSGIGFLGAGAIMKEGTNVIGLNTAATLWARLRWAAALGPGCCPRRCWPRCSCWRATRCCGRWSTASTAVR